MNVVLLVVDSLRARSLQPGDGAPRTPFLQRLGTETMAFQRAYATECWTLPAHCSMFTGLLPSEHQAHFQTMAYTQPTPTLAELLSDAGFHTEVVTRNFVFDGTIPGITRGFRANTRPLSALGRLNPFAWIVALAKPRFRRLVRTSGFFHPLHRANRQFLTTFARALMPADRLALTYVLEQMAQHRRRGTPYFLFCNLYDVHAPYPPSPTSILRPFGTLAGCLENLTFPFVMSSLGGHTYLRPGFHLSRRSRAMLLGRYHRAIELMDAKLADFYTAARRSGLLDNTLLIVTSDHGEAFGEHGLYHHDASVYNVNLHVPLWIHHPARPPAVVDDVVSTRDLFGLMRAAALGEDVGETILDAGYRARHPLALAEHFYYPHAPWMHPRFRQNLAAAITRTAKVIRRRDGTESYDLERDPDETTPLDGRVSDLTAGGGREGITDAASSTSLAGLRSWVCDGSDDGPRLPAKVR
jgi:hypothetical protein